MDDRGQHQQPSSITESAMALITPPDSCLQTDSTTFDTTVSTGSSTAVYTASIFSTPMSPGGRSKRNMEQSDASSSPTGQVGYSTLKRQRMQTTESLTTSHKTAFLTPPSSPLYLLSHTVRLSLDIPQKELSKDEQRTFKIRRASAERWKSKLQRSFPSKKEIREAYSGKLMRHYGGCLTIAESNFMKPRIDRSPRVENLLRRFPLLSTNLMPAVSATASKPYDSMSSHTSPDEDEVEKHRTLLKRNKAITRSQHAQRMAWRSFSSRERDRIDRGREAMMQSGLWEDDLEKEDRGKPNALPEWRKANTGFFAREQL